MLGGTIGRRPPGSLSAGSSATFSFVVHVLSSVPDQTAISNTAQVSSDTPDPNPTNNVSTADINVVAVADVSTTLSSNTGIPVFENDNLATR